MLQRMSARAPKLHRMQTLSDMLDELDLGKSDAGTNTYASLIRHCGDSRALLEGRRLHAHITEGRYGRNRFLANLLVQMYGKCGSLEDARSVFNSIFDRNMFSWTIIIGAYAQNGHGWEVIDLYHEMDLDGIKPDNVTFVSILTACSNAGALAEGKAVHARIIDCGFSSDIVVACALINMYGKCRAPEDARSVFDKMAERDIVTWNAMLAADAQNGHCREAIALYRQMERQGIEADNVTYITVLYACSCLEDLEEGMKIHSVLASSRRLEEDVTLANALVTMYYKCQRLDCAQEVFDKLLRRNEATWNAMITANAQCGQGRDALYLFRRMDQEGVKADEITFMSVLDACCLLGELDVGRNVHARIISSGLDQHVFLGTTLVNMYGKCGSLDDAIDVFSNMKTKSLITWTAMIAAYAQNGHSRQALELYHNMQEENIKPDNVAFISIVDACSSLGDLKEGREVHERLIARGFDSDVVVCNALITMYNKCGSLAGARSIFDKTKNKNVISWNAMIAAYCEHGLNQDAINLFGEMLNEGIQPDDISFVSILFACSHAGLFDEGWQHFVSMAQDYKIPARIDHYVCMVDLLGRAGRLEEAEELLDTMPFRADTTAWTTLLSACKMHQSTEGGERIAKKVLEMDPHTPGPYVLLSNMYAAVGRFADAAKVRRAMEENCLMAKLPGRSIFA